MKATFHKKLIIIAINAFFIILISNKINSQGTSISSLKPPHFFIGLTAYPSKASIINKEIETVSQVSSTKENTYSGTFEIGYYFSRHFGLFTGIGLGNYKSTFSIPSYQLSYDTIDSEHENYNRRISGSDIKEIQKITLIKVPFVAIFQIPVSRGFGLYLQSGLNISFPLKSTYSSSGVFSYSGYYPSYNVTFTNLSYEGFQNNVNSNIDGELRLKRVTAEFTGSSGIYFSLSRSVLVSIGAFYNTMLTGISDYANINSFRLSTFPEKLNSIMEGSKEVTTNCMGVDVSLRFFMK